MPDRKQERAKHKAIMDRLADMRPFVRGNARAALAGKIANSEIREDVVKQIDINIVDWPQVTWKREDEEVKAPAIKKALDAYNVYKSIVGLPGKKYDQKDIVSAWVQTFTKYELVGVKYLGIVFKDGKKVRYIIDVPSKIERSINKNSEHKFDTYVPA